MDKLYKKPDKAVVQMVKEFYANLENWVDDKVFIRGQWINMASEESTS